MNESKEAILERKKMIKKQSITQNTEKQKLTRRLMFTVKVYDNGEEEIELASKVIEIAPDKFVQQISKYEIGIAKTVSMPSALVFQAKNSPSWAIVNGIPIYIP